MPGPEGVAHRLQTTMANVMPPLRRLLPAIVLLALVPVLVASATASATGPPACVRSWGEARYSYPGYDHIVHIDNGCRERMHCVVSTDVDPRLIEVSVESRQHVSVVIRRASPSQGFSPRADCSAARPAQR